VKEKKDKMEWRIYRETRNTFCGMRYLSHCHTIPAAFNTR